MPSLTRVEAIARADLLAVDSYRIVLDLTADGPDFSSDTTIRFHSRALGVSTFLDLKAASVSSVLLNGTPIDPHLVSQGRLELSGLLEDNVLQVVARMAYSGDGEGLYRHTDPADGRSYLYAMSFLDAAPRWFACFDQPDLKATYDLDVRCPPDWTVIGNGAATQTQPGQWILANTKPISTYLVTLVAGPYYSITAEHDGIQLGMHARASLRQHLDAEAPEMLSVTRAAFDRYHDMFGIRYPFGEYHQAFVPDFNAGAMENPGCVTLRDQYVFRSAVTSGDRGARANTIVHEMAHMWFGDLVTMRWWDDLWLNESFAEYIAHRVCSEVTDYSSWIEFGIRRKDWGYTADQSPSTHPVAGNGSLDAQAALADFDGISYAKGAAVLKQLATYLGDDIFFAGLRAYFTAHSYGNAEFADLMDSWTAAGAHGLEYWADQWLRTAGLDTLIAELGQDGVTAGINSPDRSRRPHAVRVAGFDTKGTKLLDLGVRLGEDQLRVDAPAAVVLAVADSGDDTWAKIRFGTDGWHLVPEILPKISNTITRVVLINAVRDAVRNVEIDPAFALDTLLSAAASESDDLVAAEVLRFATTQLAGIFSPIDQRAARMARIAALADELLRNAAPSSDAQLEAVRALIRSSDDAGLLSGWLAGASVPDGLTMDAELRWSVVNRLVVLKALGTEAIDSELARDRSASGTVHAARARSLRPAPEAKASAWSLLSEPSTASAYELYATAEGFFHPEQSDLTEAYLPRYFAEIPGTAQFRKGWSLGQLASRCYPETAASTATLQLADATLARPDLDPAIRRSLVDGTDVLRRAVTSLNRYGPAPSEAQRALRSGHE
jgi:aminopeptidase N